MSGFAGIVRTDGTPVAPDELAPLMEAIAARGPHARGTWRKGPSAFGHTLFRTVDDTETETQPFDLSVPNGDSRCRASVSIVADARIDGRTDLIRKLYEAHHADRTWLKRAPDVELILQAYLAWGDGCVEHLLGDFAFAIWDGRASRLFCARDQMGVKPFYYAAVANVLIFSNALDCVRRHPLVPPALNDLAMADCLLFGSNQDARTTVYRDIMRLPGGHTLTWTLQGLQIRRYWSLPIEEPLYYRRDDDYLERFNELLEQSVSDRLRLNRAAVFMSGGIDSTLLAATAHRQLRGYSDSAVRGYTFVYSSLMEDQEQVYAEAAATHIGIPLTVAQLDAQPRWLSAEAMPTPEPVDTASDRGSHLRAYAQMADHSPIALYGEGPDNALHYEWRAHLSYLHRQKQWGRLAGDVTKLVLRHKRIPLIATIPRMVRERLSDDPWTEEFPTHLRPELVKALKLTERWREGNSLRRSAHPTRPVGHAMMSSALWQGLFESLDMAYTGTLLEVRHPYVDIRLLRFMLRLPAMPWCRRKYILRRAGRPLLPRMIIERDKTPLAALPDAQQARRLGPPPVYPSPQLRRYTTIEQLEDVHEGVTAQTHFRLAAISHWLHTRTSFS